MRNAKHFIIFAILLIVGLFFLASPVILAGSPNNGVFSDTLRTSYLGKLDIVKNIPGYANVDSSQSLGVFTNIVAWAISLVAVVFLILTIYSGLQWMTASGNEERITAARKRLVQAAIGLGITLCAYIISYAIFSFLYQQYLDVPYGGIEAPPQAQGILPCAGPNGSTPPECADQGTRIFCLTPPGNCVECITNDDCALFGIPRSGIAASATFCHPSWHICMLPEGTQCNGIFDPNLCISQGCKWIVPAPDQSLAGATWGNGGCVESNNPCPQCQSSAPLCVFHTNNNTYTCEECVDESLSPPGNREACGLLQTCVQYDCLP